MLVPIADISERHGSAIVNVTDQTLLQNYSKYFQLNCVLVFSHSYLGIKIIIIRTYKISPFHH